MVYLMCKELPIKFRRTILHTTLYHQFCSEKHRGCGIVEIRDKNGKTEQEFLREYDVTKYFRPSVTVDAVLYRKQKRGVKLLMIKRGGHPFIGSYAFPGGFVDSDEDCETAVCRELQEETSLTDIKLRQLVTASTPGRDPRWRNITVVFCAETPDEPMPKAGDDAAAAQWFDVEYADGGVLKFSGDESFDVKLNIVRDAFGRIDINKTTIAERGLTAFDHAKIIAFLIEDIRG